MSYTSSYYHVVFRTYRSDPQSLSNTIGNYTLTFTA